MNSKILTLDNNSK